VNDTRVTCGCRRRRPRASRCQPQGQPVLMRLEYDAGHGVGSTRQQRRRARPTAGPSFCASRKPVFNRAVSTSASAAQVMVVRHSPGPAGWRSVAGGWRPGGRQCRLGVAVGHTHRRCVGFAALEVLQPAAAFTGTRVGVEELSVSINSGEVQTSRGTPRNRMRCSLGLAVSCACCPATRRCGPGRTRSSCFRSSALQADDGALARFDRPLRGGEIGTADVSSGSVG